MKLTRDRLTLTGTVLALVFSLVIGGCKDPSTKDPGSTTNEPSSSGAAMRPEPTAEGNVATGDTIKIGLIAAQTGELLPWGIDSIRGGQLAAADFNEAGGVNGKKVDLLIGDSGSKPEQGKSAAEKLISDGVVGIVGEVASGITAQIAITAFEKGIPVVSIGSTRTDITDNGANIFRVCYTDDFQGPVMAQFAYDELNLRNVALVTDNKQPYSTGLSDAFRKHFEKLGGKIVDEQFYQTGDTQFSGQVTNLKASNPDGLFLSGYFNEIGPITREIRANGIDVPFMGGDGWDSTQLLNAGDSVLGAYFCNHYNNFEDRPAVKNFLEKWRAEFGKDPGTTMGALGYDAVMLVCDALTRIDGEINSKSLTEAIANTEGFKGVSGEITLMGMDGNPPKRALVVELTRQGQVARKAYETSDIK